MSRRRLEIKDRERVFDDFFKIDRFIVSHEQQDGTMSPDQTRLVFERGDSVAVLLLDMDAGCVIVTEQFKLPTLVARRRDDPSSTDGWVVEAVAGMVDQGETPEQAVVREAMEETGYRIDHPRLIAKFFSSPGGASERLFVFFAKVREKDRTGPGGGLADEDVRCLRWPLDQFLDRLETGSLEDPKLIIAGHWLRRELASLREREDLLRGMFAPGATSGELGGRRGALPLSTVRFAVIGTPGVWLGYKTGAIKDIKGVSAWVNSENTDMIMDRFIGRSISAQIRFLGANRDENGNVAEDTIAEALRAAVGRHSNVRIGTVLVTEPGTLRATHGVMRLLHVAVVEGGQGAGVKADPDRLRLCVENVLARADAENRRFWRRLLRRPNCDSILIPMFGAGEGGLAVENVASVVFEAATDFLRKAQQTSLKEIYFIAYSSRDRSACETALGRLCGDGLLTRAAD